MYCRNTGSEASEKEYGRNFKSRKLTHMNFMVVQRKTFDKCQGWFEEVVDFRAGVFLGCTSVFLPGRLRRLDLDCLQYRSCSKCMQVNNQTDKDQKVQRDLWILSNVPFGASSWFDKGCGSDASLV